MAEILPTIYTNQCDNVGSYSEDLFDNSQRCRFRRPIDCEFEIILHPHGAAVLESTGQSSSIKQRPIINKKKTSCCRCACSRKKPQIPELNFETCLSFEQVLICRCRTLVPRSQGEKPDDIFGTFRLCFNRGLTQVHYSLFVYNDFATTNTNELITRATLNAGRSDQNGPILVNLFRSAQGVASNGRLVKGTITNKNIHKISIGGFSYSSVATLLDGVRRGDIYVMVFGNDRNLERVGYGSGLLRGQIFARETS